MSDQWIQEGCVHESCRKCGRNHKLGECTPTPNEPTLTCSEVVERLPSDIGDENFSPTENNLHVVKSSQILNAAQFYAAKYRCKPEHVLAGQDNDSIPMRTVIEFAESYAEAILHSWRERRVQELAKRFDAHEWEGYRDVAICLVLGYCGFQQCQCGLPNIWERNGDKAYEMAEHVLKSDEWQ